MLPPAIPTSFVPHSASAERKFHADFSGVYGFFCYIVLAVIFALALGVFFYGRILSASQSSNDAALAKAEAAINPTTIQGFVQLRDRLASGETLLKNHIAFSGFFAALGAVMPSTIRFSSLHLSIDDTGTATLGGTGIAKNFNALAATSMVFAQDGRIKDAIFSNIAINAKDSSVSFTLAATLDPKLIVFSP